MAITEHALTKHCPQCGRRYPDEFSFCSEDAADLAFLSPPAKTASWKKIYLSLVMGIVLIGVLYTVFRPHNAHPASGASSSVPDRLAQGHPAPAPSVSPASVSDPTGWRTYQSDILDFSIQYPDNWTIISPTHLDASSTRVEFQSPDKSATILVDVTTAPSGITALQEWQDMDARFRKAYQDRYQLWELQESTLGGVPAATWEFVVQKKGPRLHKIDIGAVYEGKGYALLGEAPPADFAGWRSTFEHARRSFYWMDSSP